MGRHRKIERNSEILRLYAGGMRVKSIAERMGMSEFAVSSVVQREKQSGRLSQDGKTILLPGMDPDHCRFCGRGMLRRGVCRVPSDVAGDSSRNHASPDRIQPGVRRVARTA